MTTRRAFLAGAAAAVPLLAGRSAAAANKGKHLLLVAGTHHYHPEQSLPLLARELQRLGIRTTVLLPQGDPEENRNGVGLPGLEALEQADAAVFFLRFLTLDDVQFGHLERYLKSGRPVVGLRTSTHAFRYPAAHPRAAWNEDFGHQVLGTHYSCHMRGPTQCHTLPQTKPHPILAGIDARPFPSPGQLYVTDMAPGCVPLLAGTGQSPAEHVVSDRFGTRLIGTTHTDILAWTWQNRYAARVFATTLGHPRDFAVPPIMRLVINGIHWAAGAEIPSASTAVQTFDLPLEP